MVPRRIGDVSCGENHTVWQTQRRHEESTSHPCSLQQWSHQRLLTCFPLVPQRLRHSYSKFVTNSQTNSFTNYTFAMCLEKKDGVVFETQILRRVTKHILIELTPSVWFTMWAFFCEAKQSVRRHCGGDLNLQLCCDFALMFPALAWGGKRLCSLREREEGVQCGMGGESRQR